MQMDLLATSPRSSQIDFTFEPELGEYKTIDGEAYTNPWINYTLPQPVVVGLHLSLYLNLTFSSSGGGIVVY